MYLNMPVELNLHKGYIEINLGFEPDISVFEIEVPLIFVRNKTHNANTGVQDVTVPVEG
jgi:hypothetical protein